MKTSYKPIKICLAMLFGFILAGCMYIPGEYRQKPLFPPAWKNQIWQLPGSFHKLISYDYDLDGREELILVNENEMLFFREKQDLYEKNPFFHIITEFPIQAWDFIHCPGKKYAWLVVLAGKQILFWSDKLEKAIIVDTILQDEWQAQGKSIFSFPFFQYLNKDMVPDLVVPFRKDFSWYAALYVYREKGFESKGILDLQAPEIFSYPRLAIVQEEKTEIFFQYKEFLKIYTQDSQGNFYAQPPKIFDLKEHGKWNSSSMPLLLEIAQLNQTAEQDFIFQEIPGQNLWICLDQKECHTIPVSTLSILSIVTRDYNQDGFLDIVCTCMGNPAPLSLLWNYFFNGTLQLPLDIIFWRNTKGNFSFEKKERTWLYLPYPIKNSKKKYFWGDCNGDGFLDCLYIQGQMLYFIYDAAGFLLTKKIPFISSSLLPFIPLAIPENYSDFSLELPHFSERYILSDVKIFSIPGNYSRIALHYIDTKKEKDLLLFLLPNIR